MFSGVKVIPRDQIKGQNLDSSVSDGKKSSKRKDKRSKRKKSSQVSDSDDDDLDKIEKGSRKKKWYSSDEYSSYSSESDSGLERGRRKLKKGKTKRKKNGGKEYSSEEYSSSDDTNKRCSGRDSSGTDKNKWGSRKNQNKKSEEKRHEDSVSGDEINDQEIVRKQMGLDWMLRPGERNDGQSSIASEKELPVEAPKEEMKVNPRELNPYLRDNGSGYPEEQDGMKPDREQLLSSSVVGDGGASWRLKSLKRAKEQAAREGRQLDEVVAERWGSLGQLAGSLSSGKAAPSRAHLSAIKSRKRGSTYDQDAVAQEQDKIDAGKSTRDYLKDVSLRHSEMRRPKVNDSLSWGKRRGHHGVSAEDASLISSAFSSLNKFSNDGSFMEEALRKQRKDSSAPQVSSPSAVAELDPRENVEPREVAEEAKEELSANQLAAKALQLRLKGRHEEAQKLMEEVEKLKSKQLDGDGSKRVHSMQGTSRHISRDISSLKKQEDDADRHLARKIIQNKQYNVARQPDDEYDYDDAPRKKSRKKGEDRDRKVNQPSALSKRLLTQQERCLFCFENPNRPKHLVVSIANFTYLMLPQWQSVVPGHCCIVTVQHEASTRTVDNNVWDEIRNFKKCLIMMFAKQEKDLIFLETVMNLAQQRRHCLIECVPLPRDIAKEAPLYFKKAIDEAEDEWSQHNAKKLIDTSEKGLRASIPKDFPYFHVEFGLNRGFVHVIDDEKQFKSSLGLNVIRGMMQLPEEDMYRRRQSESVEVQRQTVASFAREWDPFDWTKQLG